MKYDLKLSDLEKIANDYGKVEILERIKGIYTSRCNEDVGLCSIMYFVLSFLPAIHEHAEYHGLEFTDNSGNYIPHWAAYKSVFPQWTRPEAWKLVYRPKVSWLDGWWLSGYWWPCEDHVARFEFLDKMIDIYKRNPLG